MDNITKVLLSITTVALVATVVVNGTNTAKVVSAASSGFSNSLAAAEKG
jgi:PRD1 phage membrane DNA delivery